MSEPTTQAGRALAEGDYWPGGDEIRRLVAAAEAEAVTEWLRSADAERRLAEAIAKAPLQDWREDDYGKRYARAILKELTGQ